VPPPKEILIATGNRHKAEEIRAILSHHLTEPIVLFSTLDFPGAGQVEENGATFLENAIIKARHYARATGKTALADDSGLLIDTLDGRPGVLSARYAPTPQARIARVLEEMRDVPAERRSARFVCVAARARPGGDVATREGRVEGWIAFEPRGTGGFGYDPIFIPAREIPGDRISDETLRAAKTLAEYAPEEKNRISHRGKAVAAIAALV
jgi:XTP/dITP diphosphohydrolase